MVETTEDNEQLNYQDRNLISSGELFPYNVPREIW